MALDLLRFLMTGVDERADLVPGITDGDRLFVANLVARFKDPAFHREEEVRYICGRLPYMREHFRNGPRGVTPYIKLTGSLDVEKLAVDKVEELPDH